MSATNPFTRPSPFRHSIQPTSPYSNPTSGLYGNSIVQSQVRAIGGGYNSGRPSFGLSSSPYAGSSSQYQTGLFKGIGTGNKNTGTGIMGLGINTGITTNTNIPTHDTSLTNLNTDPYTLSTKQNPFRRTSLLNNNYTQNNPITQSNTSNTDYYSILPSNTINNTSISTNGYQHLRYTPSSSTSPNPTSLNPRPSLTPLTRIQSNPKIQPTNTDRYSNLAYTPSPASTYNYNAYNYNSVNNDKSDAASVCSYINRISQLDDQLGMGGVGGNPFNRKNIIGGGNSSNNNYRFDNQGGMVQYKKDDTLYPALQKKDYSHLQYKGSNNQSNNTNLNVPYNIDKYRYNYQQQSKSKTKQQQPNYPSSNNNYPNKYTQNQQQSQFSNPNSKYNQKPQKYQNQYSQQPPSQKTSPYSAQAIAIANNIINPPGSSNRFNNNSGREGRDSRGKVNSLEKYRQRSPDRTQGYNRYQPVDSITKKYQFQDYNVNDQQQDVTPPSRNNPYNPNNQQQPKSNNYPIDPIPRLNINPTNNPNNNNNNNNNRYNDDLQYNFNHKFSYQYQHQQELNRVQNNYPNNNRNYSNNNMIRAQQKFDQNYINNKDKDRGHHQLNNSLDQYQSPQFGTTLNKNQLKMNNNFPSSNLRNIIRFDDEDQGYDSERQHKIQNSNKNNNNTNTNTNINTKQLAYQTRLKDRNREQIPTFQSKSKGNNKNKNYPSSIIYKGMELYRIKLE